MIDGEIIPHDLIKIYYLDAKDSVSPLVNLIKVNPQLTQDVVELAIVIGIKAAMRRIADDEGDIVLNLRDSFIDKFRWMR